MGDKNVYSENKGVDIITVLAIWQTAVVNCARVRGTGICGGMASQCMIVRGKNLYL